MTGFFLAIVAAAGFGEIEPFPGFGEIEPSAGNWNVRVEVQMVSIAPRDALTLTLIPALRDRKTVELAVERVQKMIADGSATLLAWPIIWTPNGERAVCETSEDCAIRAISTGARSRKLSES